MLRNLKYYFHGKCCYCEERRLEIWNDHDYKKLGTYLYCCQNCGGLSNRNGILYNLILLASIYLAIIEDAIIPAAILIFSGLFYFLVFKNKPVANPEEYKNKIIKRITLLVGEIFQLLIAHVPDKNANDLTKECEEMGMDRLMWDESENDYFLENTEKHLFSIPLYNEAIIKLVIVEKDVKVNEVAVQIFFEPLKKHYMENLDNELYKFIKNLFYEQFNNHFTIDKINNELDGEEYTTKSITFLSENSVVLLNQVYSSSVLTMMSFSIKDSKSLPDEFAV